MDRFSRTGVDSGARKNMAAEDPGRARRWARAALAGAMAWAALIFAGSGAMAQPSDNAPPIYTAIDERGVDLIGGRITTPLPGVSIGAPGQGGLSYQPIQGGWHYRDNHTGMVRAVGSSRVVSIAGSSEGFNPSGSNWVSAQGTGSTLTFNSSTQVWTYTSADGVVATFLRPLGQMVSMYGPYNEGLLTSVILPNGEVTNYAYETVDVMTCPIPGGGCVADPGDPWGDPFGGPGGSGYELLYTMVRLRTVSNNLGYQLHFEYQYNPPLLGPLYDTSDHSAWLHLKRIKALNNAVEICGFSFDGDCPTTGDWPTLTFASQPRFWDSVTDSLGRTTETGFSGFNITVQPPGAGSPLMTAAVNSSTWRVSSVAVGSMTWNYAYVDSGGQRTTTVMAPDSSTRVVVSSLSTGLVVSDTNEVGQTTEFQHDSSGRLTLVTYPEGNAVEYSYDARGNVTEVRRKAKPGSGLADIVTSATYPSTCTNPVICNRALTTTDANGQVTDYLYDATHGGLLRITAPAPVKNGERPQTRYGYTSMYAWYKNAAGTLAQAPSPVTRITSVSACSNTGDVLECHAMPTETLTTVDYGAAGVANNRLPVAVTVANGTGTITATTAIAYDDRGDVISVDGPLSGAADTVYYHYDALRRQIGMIGPDPDGGGPLHRRASRVMFNTAGVVTAAEGGTVTGTSLSALNAMTVLERVETDYDTLFRPIRQRVKDGSATIALQQVSYDSMGRPHCVALRMNPAAFGSPPGACTQSTAGSHGPDRITRYTYDAAGRVTVVRGGHGTVDAGPDLRIVYTANGQRANVRDRAGNRTTFLYDGHDRLYRQRYPHPTSVGTSSTTDYDQYLYDSAGRISQIRRRSGHTITAVYDLLGRVVERKTPSGQPDTSFEYDLFGRTTLISQTGGHDLVFTYDALNRQITESGPQGTISYQYNAAGQRTRMTWPDGFYVTYDYDNTGAVTHIRENGASSGAGVLATYAYDALGRMASLTRGNGVVTTASFDAASRLTELAHDPAGISWDQTVSFTYNAAGQIASRTMANDIYAFTGYTNIDVNFTVNGLNQYLSGPPSAPAYDARGNLTADGYGATGSYDYDNRLISWTPAGGPATALTYDPAGRLYQLQPTGGAGTRFLYDGPNLVGEYSTTNVLLRRYVQGPGMDAPLVRYDGAGTSNKRWLLADERGSIIAETNTSGGVSQINTYDDYGIPASGNVGRFGYTGQLWLGEIGLYSYKNRMYHPGLARFLQPDPIGLAGGLNLYAYVGGDPINFVDPWGLERLIVTAPGCPPNAVCGEEMEWFFELFNEINAHRDFLNQFVGIVPGIGGDGEEGESDPCAQSDGDRIVLQAGVGGSVAAVVPGLQGALNFTISYPEGRVRGMQVGVSGQVSGTLGLGAFIGAGMQAGGGLARRALPAGLSLSAPWYGELVGGFKLSGGVSALVDSGTPIRDWAASIGLPLPRVGVGLGLYGGIGRALVVNLASPPLFCD